MRFFCARSHQPTRSRRSGMAGSGNLETWLTEHKGERMTEEGTLSIVWDGSAYQVRYASNNPHARDRPSYACPDAATLGALLHHCGGGSEASTQAYADLGKGRVTVLVVALSPEQMQAFFA